MNRKFKVSFEVETSEDGFSEPEHGVRYADMIIPEAPTLSRTGAIPSYALIQEVLPPLVVGDTIDTNQGLVDALEGTTIINNDGDVWRKTYEGTWVTLGEDCDFSCASVYQYRPFRVIAVHQ